MAKKKVNNLTSIDISSLYNPIVFIETVLLNNKRELYTYQKFWVLKFYKHAINNFKNPSSAKKFYNIINKTRQCGYSTIYKYIVLYFCIMHKNQAFYIFSKDNTAAKRFLRDIKDMYLKIDKKWDFLKKNLLIDNKNQLVFADENGASGNLIQALSVTSGIRSMDSGMNIHICLDEMCFITDNMLKELLHGIEPMYSFVKKFPFSSLTFISTPLLSDSLFYKYWNGEDENLLKIKIMWYDIEDRYLKSNVTTKDVLKYIKDNRDYTQKDLVDLFAIDWLKDLYHRDKEVFLSEYACCFLDIKDSFFNSKDVEEVMLQNSNYLDYTEDLLKFAEQKYGEGGVLVTGYDPSLGYEKSDKCIITTFYYKEETNKFYQISSKQLKLTTPEQRKFIQTNLIDKYKDKHILAIDGGGMGGSIYQEFIYNFPNSNIIKINATAKNKVDGFTNLKHLIRNKDIRLIADINVKKDLKLVRQKQGLRNNMLIELRRDRTDKDNKNTHADLAYAIFLSTFCIYYIKDKNIELKKQKNAITIDSFVIAFFCFLSSIFLSFI